MNYKKKTVVVHNGLNIDKQYGCVIPPIYISSNYSFKDYKKSRKYDYSRKKNPTRDIIQNTIASLENGIGAIVTNSGMSAIYLAIITLLKPGDLIICPNDCYGGSYRLFKSLLEKNIYNVHFINMFCKKTFLSALLKKPQIVFIESPSNPLLNVVDLPFYCSEINKIGAISIIDNTLLSPVFQNPLKLGADLVIHSCTKYLNGHSDLIAGAIITKQNNLLNKLYWWANNIGITSSVLNDYLLLRGIRTLYIRLYKAQKNTLKIINYLKKQKLVKKIYHPSLKENVGHIFAKKQQKGFGAIISFEFNGSNNMLKKFLQTLTLFTLAESLGGVESLICHPASMTHICISKKEMLQAGISNLLLRISVGIEDVQDLINDLEHAFKSVHSIM
ncbi:cystathionine gamma-synthase [Enterobacteriaceae endosymbiont of Neohaemonia nigricornis]|uniref:cystathionine gamma-synthase n=1 Tax=Enterobacteriaceae endosymbiont of Neohaemonia nigricornis TaxID=2675792 RepID=UPI001448AEE2|nr:cystathionine gamma-synthase [Enterobacteriaceae endosymbiont of Neohaemonia nigricornis]QJC30615.1 cystathionine gamma-synthase [Enterobacteriaceae endosymbiont of Neohaemonia nigricornis]